MTSEGLPRHWRLSRGDDLKAVLQSTTHRRTPRLDIAWRPNDTDHPRLGIIVPRHGRSAVARNRLRRRLREIARRRLLPGLAPLDLVIRSRPAAYEGHAHDLIRDLEQWLDSLPR